MLLIHNPLSFDRGLFVLLQVLSQLLAVFGKALYF
ncbi:hypothetical protein CTKA_00564 [Chthonomonas calidirosea]|uniref:Uncharacterized protein n=1 Tax=Chthonomonas calidirosea (strain DSM 23976 / ICMP 18418 / T49) TaxID=1303518 RepID=S0ETH5_CHTCT|nr:hypothetical protein CCALI_00591 [Chthonomonas calidirosea T49]CEK13624.1 hypothetical protein CP488_00563 [Chthonomonas calidirosea]CEK14825.1 hypothetical protein CTKA_00564 [Chthonomonas calidirosea]